MKKFYTGKMNVFEYRSGYITQIREKQGGYATVTMQVELAPTPAMSNQQVHQRTHMCRENYIDVKEASARAYKLGFEFREVASCSGDLNGIP
jgi:hypothetical protein